MAYKDPASARARHRQYYLDNREKVLERTRAWAVANPDRRKQIEIRYRRSQGRKASDSIREGKTIWGKEREWLRLCLLGVRIRAHKTGLSFDLTHHDLETPALCPVLGLQLVYGRGRGRAQWDAPSVDRIDPSLGYTKQNCRIISLRANMLRSNCTDPDTFRALAADAERLFNG